MYPQRIHQTCTEVRKWKLSHLACIEKSKSQRKTVPASPVFAAIAADATGICDCAIDVWWSMHDVRFTMAWDLPLWIGSQRIGHQRPLPETIRNYRTPSNSRGNQRPYWEEYFQPFCKPWEDTNTHRKIEKSWQNSAGDAAFLCGWLRYL